MKNDKSSLTDTSYNEYVQVSKIINLNIDDETFIAFCLKNNYKESLHSISYSVIQKDEYDNILDTTEFTYTDFIALPNKKFMPKIRIKRVSGCKRIELNLINAKFENNEYIDGKLNILADVDMAYGKNKYRKRKKLVNKKILYSCLASISLVFCALCFLLSYTIANNTTLRANDTFTYKVENQGVTIIDYLKNDYDVVIPNDIDGNKVVSIDKDIFNNKRISNLKINASNIEIPSEMFRNNTSLLSVEANTLTLNISAFEGCTSLERFVSESSYIPQRCFYGCTSLKSISSNANYVDVSAFINCTSLEVVNLPYANMFPDMFIYSPKIKNATVGSISFDLSVVFNKETKFESLTILNGNLYESLFTDFEVTNLHISDNVYIDFDLSTLNLENYDSDDDYEYLDNIIFKIKNPSSRLIIDTTDFDIYSSAISTYPVTELTILSGFEITSVFMNKLQNISTLNLYNDNITNLDYDFANSYITTINMYVCGSTLSSIIKEYEGNLNITYGLIKNNYFDGLDFETINIGSDVNFSSDSFSGDYSIDKIVLENTAKITLANSIYNVYEIEVVNYNIALPSSNTIKKITVTGDVTQGALSTLKSIKELELSNINTTYFGQLFNYSATINTQNNYIPDSLITVVINAGSIPTNYFYNCSKLKNIDFTSAITYGDNILSNCTGLINLYIYGYSVNSITSICRSLNSLYLDHILYVQTNASYYSGSLNSNININYNVNHGKNYVITYKDNVYYYTGMYITDLHHIIGEDEEVGLSYNEMTNMYYNSYRSFNVSKREMVEIEYYDEEIYTVRFYVGNDIVEYKDLYSGDILDIQDLNIEGLLGWYTDSSFRNKYNFNSEISSNLNLYGKVASNSNSYIKPNDYEIVTMSNSTMTIYLELPLNAEVTLTIYSMDSLTIDFVKNGSAIKSLTSTGLNSPLTYTFNVQTTDTSFINITAPRGTELMYVCSAIYENSTSYSSSESKVYEHTCYTDETTFILDLSSFEKDGFEFLGLYTIDDVKIVDKNGISISYWYNYLVSNNTLYAKYERIN